MQHPAVIPASCESEGALLELRGACVRRPAVTGVDGAGSRAPRETLHEVDLCLRAGESWAVLGVSGAGKSTLLALMRGELWPSAGVRRYRVDGAWQASPISFRERSGLVGGEAQEALLRQGWQLTGLELVMAGTAGGGVACVVPTPELEGAARRAAQRVGCQDLLAGMVQELSQGQQRLLLLARALVHEPDVLFLDEPCEGLDVLARGRVLAALDELAAAGVTLVCTAHRAAELPGCVARVLELESGRVTWSGEVTAWRERQDQQDRAAQSKPCPPGEPCLVEAVPALVPRSEHDADFIFELRDVSLQADGKELLHIPRWRMEPGQHWALTGPNGAGKSSLLKLLAGELHAVPGGRVGRFGAWKPESLWAIRRRVGLVSFELQAAFPQQVTALEAAASGFFGHVGLYEEPDAAQFDAAREALEALGVGDLAPRELGQLSSGQRRRVLLARALVHAPRVLLLDEPLAGLDGRARDGFHGLLGRLAEAGTQVLYASHHMDELPGWIGHELRLKSGEIVFSGPRGGY